MAGEGVTEVRKDRRSDPDVLMTELWDEVISLGFERYRIDEARHPSGAKVSIGYSHHDVRVRVTSPGAASAAIYDIDLSDTHNVGPALRAVHEVIS